MNARDGSDAQVELTAFDFGGGLVPAHRHGNGVRRGAGEMIEMTDETQAIEHVNQTVTVELTEYGAEKLNELYTEDCRRARLSPNPGRLVKKGDLYTTVLWTLLQDFGGERFGIGSMAPFTNLRVAGEKREREV